MSDNEENFLSMAEARRVAYERKRINKELRSENEKLRSKLKTYEESLKHIRFFMGEFAADRIDSGTLSAKVGIEIALALPRNEPLISNV